MAQKHNAEYTEKPMTRDGSIQGPSRRYRRLRHPNFPAAEWASKNPLLQRGEIGIEIDTNRMKVGNGYTLWNDLPYAAETVAKWGEIIGDIDDQSDLIQKITDAVDAEAQLRANADDTLQNNIDGVADNLTDEIHNREDADSGLQDQITDNKNTMDDHIADTDNPHSVTKDQVGLGNCDNTSDLDKPISTATQTALDNKVDKNAAITGATKCKITYDNKGLVTGGADLAESDIPALHLSKITDVTASAAEVNVLDGMTASTAELNVLDGITATTTELNYTDGVTSNIQTQLDSKVAANAAITGATHTKITYDNKGLVTGGTDITLADVTDITASAAEVNVLDGITANTTELNVLDGITASTAELNILDGVTATTAELNVLDGITATTTELNYVDGVTSPIQTQISNNKTAIDNHVADTNNPHSVTKAQVGLGNCDNTSDLNKPISTATQTALDGKQAKSADSYNMGNSTGGWTAMTTAQQNALNSGATTTNIGQIATNTNDIADINTTIGGYGDIVTHDVSEFATAAQGALADTAVQPGDLAAVATSGSYNDLIDKPTIGNATLTIQKNGTNVDTFTANATTNKSINITVPVTAADVNALPDSTKYVANASMTINNTTYVVTLQLKDQDGNNIGTAQTVDLPLETMVVSGSYDDATKKIILTLQNGQTIEFSVADLVSGLQTEITANNMLDADLVDDSTSTNKFVTSSDITTWNGKQDALTAGANINISGTTISATDTTYTGSDGITLTGTNFTNSGVRSVATGTANGTIAVNTNGTTADVSVKGLGSAAYTASTAYATAAQGALADTALQSGDNVSELVNDAGYLTTHQTLADLGITATASEINVLDGITASTTELNYVDGVTSSIQTQLNGKQATISDLSTIRSGAALGATAVQPGDLATVATTGDYDDLLNKPTLGTMAAESASDYTPTANLATVATSGLYSDLSGTPTIPTTLAALTGDVSISSPSNGEHLVYNGTSQKWENTASAATVSWGGITGTLSNQTDLQNALNGKSDTDFSNVSATGKETATNWGLPDYDHPITISTFNSSNPYTAPKDGLFKAVTGKSVELYVNGAEAYYGGTATGSQAWAMTAFVSKGDIITTDVNSTVRVEFFPLKGVA